MAAAIEICRRLDGIAPAIDLETARVPLLGVDGVRRGSIRVGKGQLMQRNSQRVREANLIGLQKGNQQNRAQTIAGGRCRAND